MEEMIWFILPGSDSAKIEKGQKELVAIQNKLKEAQAQILKFESDIQTKTDELMMLGAVQKSKAYVEAFLKGELRATRSATKKDGSTGYKRGRMPNLQKQQTFFESSSPDGQKNVVAETVQKLTGFNPNSIANALEELTNESFKAAIKAGLTPQSAE